MRHTGLALAGLAAVVVLGASAWIWSARGPRVEPVPATRGAGAEPGGSESPGAPAVPEPPAGEISVAVHEVILTPAAKIQAEKFRCVCGCYLMLSECTCTKTPGSIDMKQHLQALVSRGLTPSEIEKGMVGKYGPGVIPR